MASTTTHTIAPDCNIFIESIQKCTVTAQLQRGHCSEPLLTTGSPSLKTPTVIKACSELAGFKLALDHPTNNPCSDIKKGTANETVPDSQVLATNDSTPETQGPTSRLPFFAIESYETRLLESNNSEATPKIGSGSLSFDKANDMQNNVDGVLDSGDELDQDISDEALLKIFDVAVANLISQPVKPISRDFAYISKTASIPATKLAPALKHGPPPLPARTIESLRNPIEMTTSTQIQLEQAGLAAVEKRHDSPPKEHRNWPVDDSIPYVVLQADGSIIEFSKKLPCTIRTVGPSADQSPPSSLKPSKKWLKRVSSAIALRANVFSFMRKSKDETLHKQLPLGDTSLARKVGLAPERRTCVVITTRCFLGFCDQPGCGEN